MDKVDESTTAQMMLRGTVTRIFFSNPDGPFMAGVMRLDEGGEAKFSGKVTAQAGDKLELSGAWVVHPKFGRQFEADTGIVKMDESPDALAHLLASDDRFQGLGPVRARKVVEAALHLSSDGSLGAALAEYADEIARRAGAPLEAVLNAAKVWNERRSYFEALAALAEQGWSGAQAQLIVRKFGENAATMVKQDPYGLIGKIPRFGFRTVDAIARKMGVKSIDPGRMLAGVAFCLQRVAEEGHTWTTREGVLAAAAQELRPDTLDGEGAIAAALQALIDDGIAHLDTSPQGTEVVADARTAAAEFEVFQRLMAGLGEDCSGAISFQGPRAVEVVKTVNRGQGDALLGFANYRVVVISGGAGVGKTYTMRAVCEVAEENGLTIALCAPTGKAARKLAHATGRKAQTIHRLLEPMFDEETGAFRFSRHEGNPLSVGLVVVDEVSMADIRLMRSLLSAMPPTTRLLLVGDHNQIPSVSAGAILRDVLSAQAKFPGAIHILNEVVRQAGMLARNTRALLDGVVASKEESVWRIQKTERGNEEGSEAICAMVVEGFVTGEPRAPFNEVLDLAWDVQVLAPKREGPLGVYALNVHLQKLRQRLLGNPPPDPVEQNKPPKPLLGDRIIWTHNDYELGLLNGDQAIVTALKKEGAMDIFTEDGREVTIPAAKRKHIEVAYAMTIHKSQGSEWPVVICVISSSHYFMRDRNLLYTGVSRASEVAVILGDAQGVRAFADHKKSHARQTFGKFLVHGWQPKAHLTP